MREFLSITKVLSDESRVRTLLSIKDGESCQCQIIVEPVGQTAPNPS